MRGMKQGIAIADTMVSVYDCQVLLGHPDAGKATDSALQFSKDLTHVVSRSQQITLRDVIYKSIEYREQLLN